MRSMGKSGEKFFSGKSTLVVILGVHGGGAATAKWLHKHGAKVTVTDLRTKAALAHSLKRFTPKELKEIRFVLGGQHEKDFRTHDVIVIGPGVPRESVYLAAAKAARRPIENDASLFFRYVASPVIGVTGTRGKTTTTAWIAQLLKKKYGKLTPTGNNPEHPFFAELDRKKKKGTPVIAELSSWQLEYLPLSCCAPRIAAITNIYPDHLNRYRDLKDYADAKANIFVHQKRGDALILNYDNPWHAHFAKKKLKSTLYYISKRELPSRLNGLFVRNGKFILRKKSKEKILGSGEGFAKERGEHNLENLLVAALAVALFDPQVKITERDVRALVAPHMRQETIFQNGELVVVNDSCATSPDGTIAAIKRFSQLGHPMSKLILIVGGADKELKFDELAKTIRKHVEPEHLILLEGSATTKLIEHLQIFNFPACVRSRAGRQFSIFNKMPNLKACVAKAFHIAKEIKGNKVILFSPGATSFEKYLHEFDRGEHFNKLARKNLKKPRPTSS